jgi:hypothetical protein
MKNALLFVLLSLVMSANGFAQGVTSESRRVAEVKESLQEARSLLDPNSSTRWLTLIKPLYSVITHEQYHEIPYFKEIALGLTIERVIHRFDPRNGTKNPDGKFASTFQLENEALELIYSEFFRLSANQEVKKDASGVSHEYLRNWLQWALERKDKLTPIQNYAITRYVAGLLDQSSFIVESLQEFPDVVMNPAVVEEIKWSDQQYSEAAQKILQLVK